MTKRTTRNPNIHRHREIRVCQGQAGWGGPLFWPSLALFFMSFCVCAHNFKAFPTFIFVTSGFKLPQSWPSRGNYGLKM